MKLLQELKEELSVTNIPLDYLNPSLSEKLQKRPILPERDSLSDWPGGLPHLLNGDLFYISHPSNVQVIVTDLVKLGQFSGTPWDTYRAYYCKMGKWCLLQIREPFPENAFIEKKRFIQESEYLCNLRRDSQRRNYLGYGFSEHRDRPYRIVEMWGSDLAYVLERYNPYEKLTFFVYLVEALHRLHVQGRTALLDYKHVLFQEGLPILQIRTMDVLPSKSGTLAWMAPEVAKHHPENPISDIFDLGCLLFWLFTGCHPCWGGHKFREDSEIILAKQVTRTLHDFDPDPMDELEYTEDPELKALYTYVKDMVRIMTKYCARERPSILEVLDHCDNIRDEMKRLRRKKGRA